MSNNPVGTRSMRRPAGRTRSVRGFTMPEAIIALVVIGIGLAGVTLAFTTTLRRDGDALVQRQMASIAHEMLEEVMLKPYTTSANTAPAGCARDTFNDVTDYNNYSASGICTIDGVAIAALSDYSVGVTVTDTAFNGVAAAKRIVITVGNHGDSLQVVGWRTDYASP